VESATRAISSRERPIEVEHDAGAFSPPVRAYVSRPNRVIETDDKRHLPVDPVEAPQRPLESIGQRGRVRLQHGGPVDVVQAMLEVDENLHVVSVIKAVALQGDRSRRGQLHPHPVLRKPNAVVPRPRLLFGLGGGETLPSGLSTSTLVGLQEHIAQLGDARATVVSIGKSEDARIPILVAPAVSPAVVGIVRTREHHAEGDGRAGHATTGAVRTDEESTSAV
jgi:hypothetical protein